MDIMHGAARNIYFVADDDGGLGLLGEIIITVDRPGVRMEDGGPKLGREVGQIRFAGTPNDLRALAKILADVADEAESKLEAVLARAAGVNAEEAEDERDAATGAV